MTYMVITIILLTFIMYYLLNDINNMLRLNSIITIISGYIIIFLNVIINAILNKKITYINIKDLANHIRNIGINKGLILILIGTIQLIMYMLIRIYKQRIK